MCDRKKNIFSEGKYLSLKDMKDKSQIEELVNNQKYYEYLTINCHLDNQNSIIVGNSIRNLTQLIALKICFGTSNFTAVRQINKLSQSLGVLINLKFLHIEIKDIQEESNSHDNFIIHLAKGLSHLNILEEFSLILELPKFLSSEGVQELNQSLIKLKMLSNLIIQFFNVSSELNTQFIAEFCRVLKHLVGLKKLDFSIDRRKIQFKQDFELSNIQLNTLVNLQKLKLELIDDQNFNDLDIQEFQHKLTSLPAIRSLSLNFLYFYTKVTEKMNEFLNHIIAIKHLNKLKINLKIQDTSSKVFKIGSNLKSPSQLKVFILTLNCYYYSLSQRYISFEENIVFLENLEKLNIDVGSCNTQLEVLENMSKLFLVAHKLQELSLRHHSPLLESDQLISFGNSISALKNLKRLKLKILVRQRKEDSCSGFMEGISTIFNLETLQINSNQYLLVDCQNSSLSNLTNLHKLSIKADNEATNKDLETFGNYLQQLRQINQLKFKLLIKNKNIDSIIKNIGQLGELRVLKLSLIDKSDENEKFFDFNQAKSLLNQLQNLKKLIEVNINICIKGSQRNAYQLELIRWITQLPKLVKMSMCDTYLYEIAIKRKQLRIVQLG